MKKLLSFLTAMLLCILSTPMIVSAASATASLTGPGTIRAGDTLTVTFNLKGNGISGASGALSYNGNQLQLIGTKQTIASPWKVEFNGNNMIAYDDEFTHPINSTKALFTVSFKVKNVPAGTKITVSYIGVKASDGNSDINIGNISHSATAAAPLSTDNNLASLSTGNITISPAFRTGVTKYTAKVPFSVSKLDVKATAADHRAKVNIHSPNLTPDGNTNVTVTVTAESGAKKVYTIQVYREKDPNYVPSGNNTLANISAEGFLLSPVFNTDIAQYIVWLPYETTSIKINGSAADKKATVQVVGGDSLAAGQDNPVKIICTAENGEKKEYTVIAKRAAAHDGSVDAVPNQTEDKEKDASSPNIKIKDNSTKAVPWWGALLTGIAGIGIGIVSGLFVFKKKS